MVKIPATAEGLGRDPADDRRGPQHQRHADLQPRPLRRGDRGLPRRSRAATPPTPAPTCPRVASVASFFISRVDTEIDRRLEAIGSDEALALRGKAAVAQGKLAYQLFAARSPGRAGTRSPRTGARVQRPLWASTSTKNPAYPDTLYVDELIGPHTVNTLPDTTIEAFDDHGTLARRVDADVDEAEAVWAALADVGVDIDDVAATLEREGVAELPEELRRADHRAGDQGLRAFIAARPHVSLRPQVGRASACRWRFPRRRRGSCQG